mgnify:FL=1
MNKKKAYIAPAILSITVCPALNILAGSVTDTGIDFRNIDSGETGGDEFKSKININDVWE